jgi:hypothetical protein
MPNQAKVENRSCFRLQIIYTHVILSQFFRQFFLRSRPSSVDYQSNCQNIAIGPTEEFVNAVNNVAVYIIKVLLYGQLQNSYKTVLVLYMVDN